MIEAVAGMTATWAANLLLHSTVVVAAVLAMAQGARRRSAVCELRTLRMGLAAVWCMPLTATVVQHYGWNPWAIALPEPTLPGAALGWGAGGSVASGAVLGVYLLVAAAWVIGTGAMLGLLARDWRRLVCLRRQAADASAELTGRVAELASRLGVTPPRVMVSARVRTPCVFGCLRPTLLVPASTGGESVIGDAVLAHELCHLRQRDCVWRWAGRVAIAWLFFQPLLGVLCRRIDEVCEAVCDDAAVMMTDDRRGYARELVRWSGVGGDAGSEGLAMGAAALRSRLGRRIERVLQSSETRMSARGGRAEAVVMGLAVAAVAIGVNAVCLAHTTAAGLAGVAWVWCMG